jgi:hypothetical protein
MNEKNTSARLRLPMGESLLLALSLIFFLSFFAFTEVVLCRYMVVAVFVLLLFIAVRSRLVTVLSILPCLLAFAGAESSPLMSILLCTVAVIGFGGFAVHTVRLPIVISIPVLSFLLVWAVTNDPMQALWILILVPVAVTSALAMRYKLTRTGAVAAVAVVLCVITVIFLYAALIPSGTVLTKELIGQTIAEFRDAVAEQFSKVPESMALAESMGGISEEDIRNVLNSALRLLPAVFIIMLELVAYLGCLIAVTLRSKQFPEHPLPEKCLSFRMSAVSAVLFLICFVLSLLPMGSSDATGIALITALNLFVILQPGLAVCGILSLLASFKRNRGCFPIFILVLSVWFISVIPTILALIGAVAVLRTEKQVNRHCR